MPKYRIKNSYSDTVFYDEIVEIEADDADDAREKFHGGGSVEDYIVISTEESERDDRIYSEIEDIEEIL
jgi:hypothetical protein